ncbi:MAG: hypothetical protein H6648_07860 [Caldilineae bacterium]|nr:hypothetical protein [Chloroflexota bacterium]MCB9177059.1 hypothetical protein [Caldilineae bacterium]
MCENRFPARECTLRRRSRAGPASPRRLTVPIAASLGLWLAGAGVLAAPIEPDAWMPTGSFGSGPSQVRATADGPAASAAVPALINFQGRLSGADGWPLPDGEHALDVALYATAVGGSPLWRERKTLRLEGGLFTTQLGDSRPLDPSLAALGELWVGLGIDGAAEMGPRIRLTSAPFALRSADADALAGQTASDFAAADHGHDARYVKVEGDRMEAALSRAPVLEVVNRLDGYGIAGESAANIGVLGSAGSGAGLLGISGLTGVYGSGERIGVVGAGRETGVSGIATGASGDATGVRGRGTIGVWGESESGTALHGDGGQYGVYGESASGMGVFGHAAGSAPAIAGRSDGSGAGVEGRSDAGNGLSGIGANGVKGLSNLALGGTGVWGSADHGTGIFGEGGLSGVHGEGQQRGVYAKSTEGIGLLAESRDGVAVFAVGEVAQSPGADGLVKAGVYAWCDQSGARIVRTFSNVHASDGSVAMIGIVGGKQVGDCSIDFGFDAGSRFVQATAVSRSLGREARGVTIRDGGPSGEVLGFFRWDAAGVGEAGYIQVLVY